jgi:hypothetical protein
MRPRSTGPAHACVLHDLDLLALWPGSIADGNEVKSLHSPAGSRFEVKSGAPAHPRSAVRDRPGVPRVVPCSVCRLPAAGLVGGGLRTDEALVCAACVQAMTGALDERVSVRDPGHVQWLRAQGVGWLAQLDRDVLGDVLARRQPPAGPLDEALTTLAAAAVTLRARVAPRVSAWALIGQITHGRLLARPAPVAPD